MKKHVITLVILSVLSILILTGCDWLPTPFRKAMGTTIYGQVRTYGTQDAIIQKAPVKVMIVERTYSGIWGGGDNFTPLTSTWTDSSGNFTLYHKLYEGNDYYLASDPKTVHSKYIDPSYSSMDAESRRITQVGGTHNKNYYLTAYGWVRFHFVSTNPNPQQGNSYSYNLGGGGFEVFYGSVDEYRIWDFGGNIEHEVSLEMVEDGVYTNWQIPFFVPAFDTTDMEITF